MKYKLLSILMCLLFSTAIFANNILKDTRICPSIEAIKAVGIKYVEDGNYAWRGVIPHANFNTTKEWSFFLIFSNEGLSNQGDLNNKANELIGNLTTVQGPEVSGETGETWTCLYPTAQTGKQLVMGLAVTTVDQNSL